MFGKRKKPRLYLFIPFWIIIVGMFIGMFVVQFSQYEDYRRELNRLQAELAIEEQISANIIHQQAFYESDAYIEQLARDRLGFVRPDEVIFINISE